MSARQTWLFPTTKVSIIANPPDRGAARILTRKSACTYEKRYMINNHHLSFVTVFVFSLPKEWTATVSSTTLSSLGWTFLSMGLLCKRGHRAGNRTLSVSTHVMGWWYYFYGSEVGRWWSLYVWIQKYLQVSYQNCYLSYIIEGPLDAGFPHSTVRSRCLRSLLGPCRESSPIKHGTKPLPFTRIVQTGLGMKLGFRKTGIREVTD